MRKPTKRDDVVRVIEDVHLLQGLPVNFLRYYDASEPLLQREIEEVLRRLDHLCEEAKLWRYDPGPKRPRRE